MGENPSVCVCVRVEECARPTSTYYYYYNLVAARQRGQISIKNFKAVSRKTFAHSFSSLCHSGFLLILQRGENVPIIPLYYTIHIVVPTMTRSKLWRLSLPPSHYQFSSKRSPPPLHSDAISLSSKTGVALHMACVYDDDDMGGATC